MLHEFKFQTVSLTIINFLHAFLPEVYFFALTAEAQIMKHEKFLAFIQGKMCHKWIVSKQVYPFVVVLKET